MTEDVRRENEAQLFEAALEAVPKLAAVLGTGVRWISRVFYLGMVGVIGTTAWFTMMNFRMDGAEGRLASMDSTLMLMKQGQDELKMTVARGILEVAERQISDIQERDTVLEHRMDAIERRMERMDR